MASNSSLPRADADRLHADWRYLCRTIGARVAGGPGERRAADYLERRFTAIGLQVDREAFPCRYLVESHSAVAGRVGKRWQSVDSLRMMNSGSTPAGRPVEGELVWMDFPESQHRLSPGSLRGKILVLFGQLPGDTRSFRKLLAARPAAVLPIDDREPFAWPIQNALLPDWVKRFGTVPAAAIAYQTAWQWRAQGVSRARVAIQTRYETRASGNVVATLPGSAPEEPAILFGAHHDTPIGLVGADDNASGVVSLLELARILAAAPQRRRTYIFASFGTEEQLSVGAAAYALRHRRELSRIGLMVNFDSISSHLGHNQLFHSGQKGLGEFFKTQLGRRGYDLELNAALNPFSDHFPFTAYGVPGVWFYRSNVRGSIRWQHHSGRNHDSLANASAAVIGGMLDALAPAILALGQARTRAWPFPRKLPAPLAAQVVRL